MAIENLRIGNIPLCGMHLNIRKRRVEHIVLKALLASAYFFLFVLRTTSKPAHIKLKVVVCIKCVFGFSALRNQQPCAWVRISRIARYIA